MANILTYLNNIKNALYGRDVRGSIHDGIKAINDEVESTTARQKQLEGTFDQLIINSGNSNAEIVAGRTNAEGKSFDTIGKRLDNTDSQIKDKANKNEVKIHFIKLNAFGESMLVKFDNKNMLIDFGQVEDKDTILLYLRKNNVSKLDYIIITHMHADHIGSLEYILNNVDISNCKAYLPCEPVFEKFNVNGEEFKTATLNVYNILNNKNIEKIFPVENETVNLGEIKLKFNNCNLQYFENYYNTVSEYSSNGETDYNNFSLVTTLIHEDVKILLPSDINVTAQNMILTDVEKCDVYKTEHHSTNSLVSSDFLNKVNADISVCCNVNQQSIFYSQTSLYHFKNKKEYYQTFNGDIVVCSNGNIAYVKSNNKRFEGETDIFYNFEHIIENYDSTTDLITIIKSMPPRTKIITTIDKGHASCPAFVSDYNATIEIYKITDSRATLSIKDCDLYNVKSYDGVWHSSKSDRIKWAQNTNSDSIIIKYYKSLNEVDSDYNENTTLISLIQKMENNSKLDADLTKGHASCPAFVSDYNATIEIYKVSENRASLTIRDFDYYNIKVHEGIWHSSKSDTITWGNVLFENNNTLKTYNSIGAMYNLGVTTSDNALTILKALPVGAFFSGNVTQSFASFISSYGGIATIEKITNNIGRIILSDANSTLGKTWIGIWHSDNGDTISWSLLTSTSV